MLTSINPRGNARGSGRRRRRVVAALVVAAIGLGALTGVASGVASADGLIPAGEAARHEAAAALVAQVSEQLAVDSPRPATVAVPPGTAEWIGKIVAQTTLKYGLEVGYDELFSAIGIGHDDTAARFAALETALGEIQNDLKELSDQVAEQNYQGAFRDRHSTAAAAAANIQNIALRITSAETSANVSQHQLESWANDNADMISALRTALTDGASGGLRDLLKWRATTYPTSTGVEITDEVHDYVASFREVLGVALLNQAWLTNEFAPNSNYDADAHHNAAAAVDAMYAMIGAPHPHTDRHVPKFIHRVGEPNAVMTQDRVRTDDEAWPTRLTDRASIDNAMSKIGSGKPGPGGERISQYMIDNGFPNDSGGVQMDYPETFYTNKVSDGRFNTYRAGWFKGAMDANTWSKNLRHEPVSVTAPGFKDPEEVNSPIYHLLPGLRAELEQRSDKGPWITPVDLNAGGFAAKMDATSIAEARDGLDITSVDRGAGNDLTVTYNPNGRTWIQIHDAETGTMLGRDWVYDGLFRFSVPAPSGAVELRVGYETGTYDDGEMDVRSSAIVTANPDATWVTISLEPTD